MTWLLAQALRPRKLTVLPEADTPHPPKAKEALSLRPRSAGSGTLSRTVPRQATGLCGRCHHLAPACLPSPWRAEPPRPTYGKGLAALKEAFMEARLVPPCSSPCDLPSLLCIPGFGLPCAWASGRHSCRQLRGGTSPQAQGGRPLLPALPEAFFTLEPGLKPRARKLPCPSSGPPANRHRATLGQTSQSAQTQRRGSPSGPVPAGQGTSEARTGFRPGSSMLLPWEGQGPSGPRWPRPAPCGHAVLR